VSTETIRALGQISRELDSAVDGLADLEQGAAKAETAFKVAHARAFLAAEGSVDARNAQAAIDTEQLRDEYEGKAAAVRVQRERIKALHARIDVGRTISAAERQLAGVS
jgi:hypothetical protein